MMTASARRGSIVDRRPVDARVRDGARGEPWSLVRSETTDAKWYPNVPTNVTCSMVTYWRARVVVRAGETAPTTMNDRTASMTAGRQESGIPAAPHATNPAGPQRR
jgi:hypothetical protein